MGQAGKSPNPQAFRIRMAGRREDGREEGGVRPRAPRGNKRPFRMAGSRQISELPPPARQFLHPAFGHMKPVRPDRGCERPVSRDKEHQAPSPGDGTQLPCQGPTVGASVMAKEDPASRRQRLGDAHRVRKARFIRKQKKRWQGASAPGLLPQSPGDPVEGGRGPVFHPQSFGYNHPMSDPAPPDPYESVLARMAAAAKSVGRPPDAITLIAVSKIFSAAAIRPLLARGHRVFGENRVQEALGKWPALRSETGGKPIQLHLIGPLQTNKVRDAMALFDVIHSLDREKLARKLADEAADKGTCPDLFVQVNTGEEPQKAGIPPGGADAFIAYARDELRLPVIGLMALPPLGEAPGPHFALLAKIAERNGLAQLSMGMSADFETAIALGATHVRVGTALFGARVKPASA